MTVTRKIYLHAKLEHPDEAPSIGICDCDMSAYGYGPVFEVRELQIEPPAAKELIAKQISLLQAERDKIYVDAAQRASAINERIQVFLAITNSPQETSS